MKTITRTSGIKDDSGAVGLVGLVTRYRQAMRPKVVEQRSVETQKVELGVQDRTRALREFGKSYEALVEVLCDAAQFGVSRALEQKYQEVRLDLVNRYASQRVFLSAYLRLSAEDSKGTAKGIRFDAFDALLAPASLELFLHSDDGSTISRVNRTREAIRLYADHLKHLAEKSR